MKKIVIKTHLIHPEGTTFEGEFPTDNLLPEDNAPMFEFTSAAGYKIFATMVGNSCILRGAVAAKGHATCVSCLAPFDLELQSKEFDLFYEPEEIPADGELNITDDVVEELLVMVLDFPKCKEDCKGLCPQCGCNRNEKTCKCKPAVDEKPLPAESPWDVLGALKLDASKKTTKKKS